MTRGGLELRVGLVVVIASVILVVGTMWFQKFQMTEQRYGIHARFGEVGGLVPGDPIFINGVELGRVRAVDLLSDRVVVELGIREGVVVPVDSRLVLKSVGIMGERFVAVTVGTGRAAVPGDTLEGVFLAGLSEVMGSAGSVVDEIAETSRNLREVVEMLTSEGKLQQTMENLAEASGNVRDVTGDGAPRLTEAIARFERVSVMMDSLVSTHYPAVDSSLAAIGRAGGKVEVTVDNLAAVSEDLREITEGLRAGKGTMGRLLTDEELIIKLESTVAGLDSLIEDIKLHPGRYVTFKIF